MKFTFDRIETRTSGGDKPRTIIKGYATVADKPYIFGYRVDNKGNPTQSLKEMFTQNAIESMRRQVMAKKVFADIEHTFAGYVNVKNALHEIAVKNGIKIDKESDEILRTFKKFEFPFAKPNLFDIDDKGLYVETETNPFFRDVDEAHRKYYDAVDGMLKSGILDRISLNFKATKIIPGEVPKIDDVDVFGISYTGGAANDWLPPVEVAMRCIQEVEDDLKCQNNQPKKQTLRRLML
jgi:hypothetical protein